MKKDRYVTIFKIWIKKDPAEEAYQQGLKHLKSGELPEDRGSVSVTSNRHRQHDDT